MCNKAKNRFTSSTIAVTESYLTISPGDEWLLTIATSIDITPEPY
jgi:hypothetical protein